MPVLGNGCSCEMGFGGGAGVNGALLIDRPSTMATDEVTEQTDQRTLASTQEPPPSQPLLPTISEPVNIHVGANHYAK